MGQACVAEEVWLFEQHSVRWAAEAAGVGLVPLSLVISIFKYVCVCARACACVFPLAVIAIHLIDLLPSSLLYVLLL